MCRIDSSLFFSIAGRPTVRFGRLDWGELPLCWCQDPQRRIGLADLPDNLRETSGRRRVRTAWTRARGESARQPEAYLAHLRNRQEFVGFNRLMATGPTQLVLLGVGLQSEIET